MVAGNLHREFDHGSSKQIASKQEDRLTGATLFARCREVMGTCVAMRVRVEGLEPKRH